MYIIAKKLEETRLLNANLVEWNFIDEIRVETLLEDCPANTLLERLKQFSDKFVLTKGDQLAIQLFNEDRGESFYIDLINNSSDVCDERFEVELGHDIHKVGIEYGISCTFEYFDFQLRQEDAGLDSSIEKFIEVSTAEEGQLEWCRANAPEAYANYSDTELLNAMSSTWETHQRGIYL